MTRVVITGIGACTAVGDDSKTCFTEFVKGTQGNQPLKQLDASKFNKPNAYEREDQGEAGKARSSHFLIRAITEAMEEVPEIESETVPVYVGTGLRELRTLEVSALQNEPTDVADLDFSKAVKSVLPNCGNVYTLSNACAASNYALALAFDQIKLGRTKMAVVAGCDTLTASMFGLLDRVNPNMPTAVQVMEKSRQGVLMGDGGVAIVLESEESAKSRQQSILAEVNSVGLSTDAVHETAPDQPGIERAITEAFAQANIDKQDIDLIYVHGTGTELNDSVESKALSNFYQTIERKPAISGIKAMTGHTSGASGCIGVMSAVESILNSVVPPTPGTSAPLDEVTDFPIYAQSHKAPIKHVQVNAFGFGGVNSVVLVSEYKESGYV
ncbi:beta-ketoacyl synthase N-terminal-like domain-containing protein [Pseudoalteromonas sp. OOF1S-7]|uniref:beta-ketoacyl-[acyl-carrier-protein] synthase family protein n=1 Tax=Pseudoalteromonas sp. OOF1S-7 TaxID=2917757 RepID=UPI001EF4F6CC|nr:beta-ketoacyl synthase N-terminal-like domain-containing protein [Pseudoalteromonas sp. OOF1S-7]MCG7536692.1 hypothetical protein [Pseudoalteromonas sp. OOF1S-7]